MTSRNTTNISHTGSGTLIENAGLSRFEIAVLTQMRYFFLSQAGLWPAHTPAPDELAKLIFHTDNPREIATVIYNFIMCVARRRQEDFSFSSPFCAGCSRIMTNHERNLMMILKSLRKGQTGRAMIHAMMMCEKGSIDDVISAADRIVQFSSLNPIGSSSEHAFKDIYL